MSTLLRSMLLCGLAAWAACSPINLGVSACASAGGTCAPFPAGCPCGQWSASTACSGSMGCCLPGSCASADLGPQTCAPAGAACVRNSDCCSDDCPKQSAGVSVCSGGGGGGGDPCAASGGTCVSNPIDCPRGHLVGSCGFGGAGVPGQCCLPGTQAVPCGAMTCGLDQVCVEPCYANVPCVPKGSGGLCPPGTAVATPACTDAGGAPGCSPSGQPACVSLPASCDLTSEATACTCFSADPCSVGTCTGGSAPGTVGCFCPPACDMATVDAFVAAHRSCTRDQDCVPLCTLGASCDTQSVNQAGATAFKSMFAGCPFPQCAIACPAGTCDSTGNCM